MSWKGPEWICLKHFWQLFVYNQVKHLLHLLCEVPSTCSSFVWELTKPFPILSLHYGSAGPPTSRGERPIWPLCQAYFRTQENKHFISIHSKFTVSSGNCCSNVWNSQDQSLVLLKVCQFMAYLTKTLPWKKNDLSFNSNDSWVMRSRIIWREKWYPLIWTSV